jgi:Protein of unknown function (DUF2642)
MDPFGHPDLQRLGRSMRDQLDETLDAEQYAARAAARRRTSLRDRLLDSEDRGEHVVVSTSDGHIYNGTVEAVGADHAVIVEGPAARYIAIAHIVVLEAR